MASTCGSQISNNVLPSFTDDVSYSNLLITNIFKSKSPIGFTSIPGFIAKKTLILYGFFHELVNVLGFLTKEPSEKKLNYINAHTINSGSANSGSANPHPESIDENRHNLHNKSKLRVTSLESHRILILFQSTT